MIKNPSSFKKPLLSVLAGETLWPPPVWLMRQAGRYLPEFREWRKKADFLTRCLTPEIATELTLQPIKRYGMDGAILFSDILILPWAMGLSLDFVPNEGPVMSPVRSREDLKKLNLEQVSNKIEPVLKTLRQLSKILDTTTLLGFAGSPFTVACYMIEGKSSREFLATKQLMLSDTLFFDELIHILVKATADMLKQQISAGAEAVMLFDSWAGIVPSSMFRRYVIEPTQKIVEEIRKTHSDIPIIGFPRQAGIMIEPYTHETGINAIGLDSGVDISLACKVVPKHVTIQGNLDPVSLMVGGQQMEDYIRQICLSMRNRPHIFNLGHGVIPQTPPENVAKLIEVIRTL